MGGGDELGRGVVGGSGVPPGQKLLGFIVAGAILMAGAIVAVAVWMR